MGPSPQQPQGPVFLSPETRYTHNLWAHSSNLKKNTFCLNFTSNYSIRSWFFTCHDSWAVVAYAKLWPDLMNIFQGSVTYFYKIFIMSSSTLCGMVPFMVVKWGNIWSWWQVMIYIFTTPGPEVNIFSLSGFPRHVKLILTCLWIRESENVSVLLTFQLF